MKQTMAIVAFAITAVLLFRAPAKAQEEWVYKNPIPMARSYCSSSVLDGKIYAIGGADGNSPVNLDVLEVYDPTTDTWAVKKEMPQPRGFGGSGVADGLIYVYGVAGRL